MAFGEEFRQDLRRFNALYKGLQNKRVGFIVWICGRVQATTRIFKV